MLIPIRWKSLLSRFRRCPSLGGFSAIIPWCIIDTKIQSSSFADTALTSPQACCRSLPDVLQFVRPFATTPTHVMVASSHAPPPADVRLPRSNLPHHPRPHSPQPTSPPLHHSPHTLT